MRSSHSLANIEDSPWSVIRKNWTIVTQIAAGVMTVVATVVAPPPTPVGTLGIRPFASPTAFSCEIGEGSQEKIAGSLFLNTHYNCVDRWTSGNRAKGWR